MSFWREHAHRLRSGLCCRLDTRYQGGLVPSVTGKSCCGGEGEVTPGGDVALKMPTFQHYVKETLSLVLNVLLDVFVMLSPSCVLPAVWVLGVGVGEFHLLLHPMVP